MPISDLYSKNLISVEKGANLRFAANLMKENNIGGLVITEVGRSDKPIGILTDRDIALCVAADNLSPDTPVEKVMSTNVVKVKSDVGIAEVVDEMCAQAVRRIVVTDEKDNIQGIVSTDDILQLMARELYSIGNLINRQIEEGVMMPDKNSSLQEERKH